jgi:hypothetical protein
MQRATTITLIVGLALGALIGAGLGWLFPVQDVGAGFDKFSPDYKADYVVMVGAAYAVDNDWDAVQSRLGLLGQPDPAGYVALLAQQYIAQGRDQDDIRNLVRLAARFGYVTSPMLPYAPASTPGSAP